MKLSDLPNIGKALEKELNSIGIMSEDDLKNSGSINKLYAIEGAIQGVRWHNLDKEYREILKTEYDKRLFKLK